MIHCQLLDDCSVRVPTGKEAALLWEQGFYGKDRRLSPVEAVHLAALDIIKVQKGAEVMSFEDLCTLFAERVPKFKTLLAIYSALRKERWVVRSGLNYGTDFVLYRSSPDLEHSQYAVYVDDSVAEGISWRTLLGINRACVGAKKTLLVGRLDDGQVRLIQLARWQPESDR